MNKLQVLVSLESSLRPGRSYMCLIRLSPKQNKSKYKVVREQTGRRDREGTGAHSQLAFSLCVYVLSRLIYEPPGTVSARCRNFFHISSPCMTLVFLPFYKLNPNSSLSSPAPLMTSSDGHPDPCLKLYS